MTKVIDDSTWNTIIECVDMLERRSKIPERNYLDDNDYFDELCRLVRRIE